MEYTPVAELQRRTAGMQKRLAERNVGVALIIQRADLFYFAGTTQNAVLLMPAEGEPVLAVQKSLTRARLECAFQQVVPMKGYRELPSILAEHGWNGGGKIGLELDIIPAYTYLKMKSLFPNNEIEDISKSVRLQRAVKSPYEIAQVEGAARQLKTAYAAIPGFLSEGPKRELDLAARIEGFLRAEGHQGLIRCRRFGMEMYFGVVSCGASASVPTGFDGCDGMEALYPAVIQGAGERELSPGEPIMIDFVGGYGGYIADKTRIFTLGDLKHKELHGAHRLALDVQQAVASNMKPGASVRDVCLAGERLVAGSPFESSFMGHGENRVGFVGHGVGLELDELPVIYSKSDMLLEEGMVIALEPKFFLGEKGGVGVENTWVVTRDGCRKLTKDNDEIVIVK